MLFTISPRWKHWSCVSWANDDPSEILNIQTSPFHIKEKRELEGGMGCIRIERIVHYPWSACHQGNGVQLAPISLSPTWSWFTIGRNCNTIRALLKKVLKRFCCECVFEVVPWCPAPRWYILSFIVPYQAVPVYQSCIYLLHIVNDSLLTCEYYFFYCKEYREKTCNVLWLLNEFLFNVWFKKDKLAELSKSWKYKINLVFKNCKGKKYKTKYKITKKRKKSLAIPREGPGTREEDWWCVKVDA